MNAPCPCCPCTLQHLTVQSYDGIGPASWTGPHCSVCFAAACLPASGIVDAQLLSWLPQGAAFINGGRGAHVVDADLLAALDSGQVGGGPGHTPDVFLHAATAVHSGIYSTSTGFLAWHLLCCGQGYLSQRLLPGHSVWAQHCACRRWAWRCWTCFVQSPCRRTAPSGPTPVWS